MTTDIFNKTVEQDLKLLSDAHNYRSWLWSKVQAHLGRRILEIGAGIGNYSQYMLDAELLVLTDYDPRYVSQLESRWGGRGNVRVMPLDLARLSPQALSPLEGLGLDTVVCLNVLEHIADDEGVVRDLGGLLAPGGKLVFINPGHPFLFSALDAAYGHHRRYDRRDCARLAAAAGLRVAEASHFNLVGAAGWWWNHRLLGRTSLPPNQTALFDRLVPLFRRLDGLGRRRFGLSILCVLERR